MSSEKAYGQIDARIFLIADAIAEEHLPRSRFAEFFFPIRRLVQKIRLRTAIYNALVSEAQEPRP
jgi:hypothetical protein